MKFDIPNYLKTRGIEFSVNVKEAICTCLWCHKPRHLYINTRTGNYVCHRCGEHGRNLLGVVCKLEDCSFTEAAHFLSRNEPEPKRNLRPSELRERIYKLKRKKEAKTRECVELPPEFIPVFKKGKWSYPFYLKERGITKETAREFNVGYCDDGKYAGRIVLPFTCPNGSGFTARDISGYAKQKYLNAGGTNRRSLFYGWQEDRIGADLVLCEGPFDVLKLHEHGIRAMGLLGKTMSRGQHFLLSKLPVDIAITVMLDPEAEIESLKIVKALGARFNEIYIAQLPAGIDPGDSTAEQAWNALNRSEKIGNSRLKISEKKLFHVKRRFSELVV